MAASEIEICNLALGHLRQNTITAFNNLSPAAKQASIFYRQAIDTAIRAFDWPFARSYAPGTRADVACPPGWIYAYETPADCLCLREIARPNRLDPIIPYHIARVSGRSVIFTNCAAPVFRYSARVTDVADYDVEFVEAAAYTLAMALAMPLTGKISLVDAMRKLAAGVVAQAQVDAANEDTNDIGEDPVPDWLGVRGIPSLTRAERAQGAMYGAHVGPLAVHYLPNESGAPAPAMLTGSPSELEAAYVPGLTAPLEPPMPILGSSDFTVAVDGKREGYAGQDVDGDGDLDNFDALLALISAGMGGSGQEG